MEVSKRRAWWFERQGLGGRLDGQSPGRVLAQTGWARSVGGANPYLSLFARSGASREQVDDAVAQTLIHELPSIRNCTYVVPTEHYALALRLARGVGDPPDIALAKRHLGVTDHEIGVLSEKVQRVLEDGPLDPREMKAPLGDAVRSLGEEGKRRGIGTTLPMVLGLLQVEGRIRRIPANGRLDNQRFKYALWRPSPTDGANLSFEEAAEAFARLYFRWIGPSTRSSFQSVAGLGVKAAEAAIAPLGLTPLEPGSDLFGYPEDVEAFHAYRVPTEPHYVLTSNLDNLTHLHWGRLAEFVDEADRGRPAFGSKGLTNLGSLSDLESHPIYDRGRLVGLWEFDGEAGEIAWTRFIEPSADLEAAVRRMEAYGRDQLGDIRSFSLDSPESRRPRLAALRAGG